MKPRSSRRFLNSPQLRSFNVALTFASKHVLLAVAYSLGAVSLSPLASAAILTYDADLANTGAQDGAGAGWNVAADPVNWWNGTADVKWSTANTTADTAVFGAGGTIANAAAGTVTVGTVNVGTISFAPTTTTGYTLASGTITLGTGITTTNTLGSTISAKISGTNGLAFNGVLNAQNGVTLSGANDYTGITTLSTGGRITTGSGTALGSSSGATASALGTNYTQINTLATVVVGNSTSEAFLINGLGSISSGNAPGALRLNNGVTLSSLVQLGSNAQISGNFSAGTISGNLDLVSFNASIGNGNGSFNQPNGLTISGLVTGATGGFDISANGGTNLVNLTNTSTVTPNTYGGTTKINGSGTVGLGGDTVLGGSTLNFNGGGVQSTSATPRTIANTISITGSSVTTLTFGQTTTQTGTLNFTYNAALVSLGTQTRTFTTNVDTTFAAGFSNSAGLIKAGAATLLLTNTASTRTGATTINAGILNVAKLADGGSNSSIGAAAATVGLLQFGGGTLQYNGSTVQTTNRLFTLNTGGGTIDASGSAIGATVSFTGTGALDTGSGATARTLTLTGSNAGVNSLASTLGTGTSTISLAKTGNGTWALTGANAYDGGTTVSAGRLIIAGNQTGSGQIVVSNAAALQFGDGTSTNGSSVNSGTIFVNNTGTVAINKLTGGTISNQVASNPNATTTLLGLNATGTTNTFTGTAYNNFSSPNNGTFVVTSTNAGATLAFTGGTAGVDGAIDLKGTNLPVGGAGNTLIGGVGSGIYGSGGSVTKSGTGTLIYQANNGYTGTTAINAGDVRVDTAQTNGGTYFVGDGLALATPAALYLGGGSAGLIGGVTFNRSVSVNPGDGTDRTLGGTNTSGTNTFSGTVDMSGTFGQNRSANLTAAAGGTVEFSNVISGAGQGITKIGSGTVKLSGANTYTGSTTILAGILNVVTGSLAGGSAVTVGGAGSSGTPTLAGTGTIGGATVIAAAGGGVAGTHSVGDRDPSTGASLVGPQNFSSTLKYETGSIFEWDLVAVASPDPGVVADAATGTYDKVVAAGAVTGGASIFKVVLGGNSFTDLFWNTDKSWTNIFSSGTGSATLASIFQTFSGTGVAVDGVVSGQGQFGFTSNTLTWSAVPEPTSALAGLLLGAGLLRRRRSA